STCFSAPVVVVNGPVARRIGMNAGLNVLGQGNRANATIGRALNLIVRNVGGGRPGEIDRATFGSASKFTQCFAEDETDPGWEPLATSRGIPPGRDAVTLFAGEGVQGFVDQRSRTPEELSRSLAMSLLAVGHPKLCEWAFTLLLLSPEHYAIYREAGWGRAEIKAALLEETRRPGREVVRGAGGVPEGMSGSRAGETISKFPPDGLLIVRAGGPAGLFSAILAGWPGGRAHEHSHPITREIAT
ncbi:MAG: thioredoxin, partial [Gemmatimonadota bacterium]|nr:thioredoxin [Gemmatimonadota bacterium]